MTFSVLGAHGADADRWRAVLAGYPAQLRDLHYRPEYGLVYRDTYGFEPGLALLETDANVVVHAFVRRALDELPFLAATPHAGHYTDVATPYGFGGPLLRDASDAAAGPLLREFDAHWRAWCERERIASEFVCLHPVTGNAAAIAASAIVAPEPAKEVVIVDLEATESALWSRVSRGTRSSIQRARREGVEVERVPPDASALGAFHCLYSRTMARLGAAARWRFPEAYFRSCVERLGDDGSALFFARCRGELAAAYLLIRDARTAYYHFGASDERWLALRPNNLLMYETLLWAKRQGCARYHLGGGVSAQGNDSLLRFKSSFGGVRALLYTYGRILHADAYRELCELKLRHEEREGSTIAAPDYFPRYRR